MASCNLDLHEINKAIIGRDRDASHARREVKLHHPLCSFLQVVIVGHDNWTRKTTTLAQPPHHAYHHPWRPNTTMKSKLASTNPPPTMASRLRSRPHKKEKENKTPKKILQDSPPIRVLQYNNNNNKSNAFSRKTSIKNSKSGNQWGVSCSRATNFPRTDQKVGSLERENCWLMLWWFWSKFCFETIVKTSPHWRIDSDLISFSILKFKK